MVQKSAGAVDAFWQKYPFFQRALERAVRASMMQVARECSGKRLLMDCTQMLRRQDAMTGDVIGIFADILKACKNNEALAQSAFADIIKGIVETLEIKIDSLLESRQAFMQEVSALLDAFAETEPTRAIFDDAAIVAEGVQNVLAALITPEEEECDGAAVIRRVLEDHEQNKSLAACREEWIRAQGQMADAVQRKLAKYKKDHLLFECSTFEEILHYSVSRLRVSENAAVLVFVAAVDAGMARLEAMLAAYGITMIRPEPHEVFNGREHEVLMAEVHSGFQKGEIVKYMNSGYREGETVLLRANVVAAK